MTCRDVRELADSFLAEELLTETNHEILRHLETCPVCRADLAARRELREGLRRAFQQAPDLGPSPAFLANLRATLETAAHKPARRGIRFQGWWVLAATVLLAVAVGFLYGGREWLSAAGALARAAVGDHRNCALQFRLAERPITLEEAARRYGDVYRVLETLPPRDVVDRGRRGPRPRTPCLRLQRPAIRPRRARVSRREGISARDRRRRRRPAQAPGRCVPAGDYGGTHRRCDCCLVSIGPSHGLLRRRHHSSPT